MATDLGTFDVKEILLNNYPAVMSGTYAYVNATTSYWKFNGYQWGDTHTAKLDTEIANIEARLTALEGDDTSIHVASIALTPTTKTISLGGTITQQLVASILPTTALVQTITWTTSNASFATVSASGLVTGIGIGVATITATTTDKAKTATCIVTVTA